ncbi:MAG: hypothetical protein CL608_06970 [Anaerolineaceae bacterium]|nr:hypothetical protein [Anaerolineaceae bacterium]
MIGEPCVFRATVPRPVPPETIASIHFFLESLPQFNPTDFTLVLDREAGTYIHPSEEFQDQEWLATYQEPRWIDLPTALDWAYQLLETFKVERFLTVRKPMLVLSRGRSDEYFFHRYSHHYQATQQEILKSIGSLLPGPAANFQTGEILHEEIASLFRVYDELDKSPDVIFLWCGSFLDTAANWPDELLHLIPRLNGPQPAFVAYSTNGANHFGRIAAKFLDVTLPERATDAELLHAILPWGARTRLFCHDSLNLVDSYKFYFCYIRPLREYPPVRLEIPPKIPLKEIDHLLDRVMAHIILNPNIL